MKGNIKLEKKQPFIVRYFFSFIFLFSLFLVSASSFAATPESLPSVGDVLQFAFANSLEKTPALPAVKKEEKVEVKNIKEHPQQEKKTIAPLMQEGFSSLLQEKEEVVPVQPTLKQVQTLNVQPVQEEVIAQEEPVIELLPEEEEPQIRLPEKEDEEEIKTALEIPAAKEKRKEKASDKPQEENPSFDFSVPESFLSSELGEEEFSDQVSTGSSSFSYFFGRAGDVLPLNVSDADSQPVDITEPVGLYEAIAYALKNSYEVQASMEQKDSARWDKYGAYGSYLPSIEFSSARGKEHSRPGSYNDGDGNRVMDTTHFRTDRQVSVRQPLIDPSVIASIIKSTDQESVVSVQDKEVREETIYDTAVTFVQLLKAKCTLDLIDQYLANLKTLHEKMKTRLEGGLATRSDLERVYSRITLAQAKRLEALGAYTTKFRELHRLTRVVPAALKVPDAFSPSVPQDLFKALKVAMKNNPSYLESRGKIDVARSDRNTAFSNLLPKLSLEYTRTTTYNAGGAAEGNPVDGVYPKQDDESLMLVAKWSLAGGIHVASGFSGEAKVRRMIMLSRDVKDRVETAIKTGYDALKAAKGRITILEDTYKSDLRIVKDFQLQYTQGTRSLFELLDAYDRLHNSKLVLMNTIVSESELAYQIRRQMGTLTKNFIGKMES